VYTRSATAVAASAAKYHQQQSSEAFIDYSDIVLDGVTIPDAVFSVAIEPQSSSQQVSTTLFVIIHCHTLSLLLTYALLSKH
jgi:uncharacterized phosphosugar-binding protein